jgi:serine/threonine-protein kinase
VADFGIAKAWADEDAVSQTRAGIAMGTPQYMAPEQAKSAKDVDHRADIFALGCILYELVCGEQAFQGDNLPTIFNQVLSGDYRSPRDLVPGLPPRVSNTIRGCLAVEPGERPQTCAEVLKILDGDAQPKAPMSGPTPLTPAKRDMRMAVGGAVGMLGMLGLVGAVLLAGAVGFAAANWDSDSTEDATVADADEEDEAPQATEPGTDEPTEAPAGEPTGTCAGEDGEVVGYANVKGVFFPKAGATWFLARPQAVYKSYPREGNGFKADRTVVCNLPSAVTVTMVADPIKVKAQGWWIPIAAGRIQGLD